MIRRYGPYALAGFAVWFLVAQPENAAGIVRGVWQILVGAAQSLSTFVNALS